MFATTIASPSSTPSYQPTPLTADDLEAVLAPVLTQIHVKSSTASEPDADHSVRAPSSSGNESRRAEVALVLLDNIEKRLDVCTENVSSVAPHTLGALCQELHDLREATVAIRRRSSIIYQRKEKILVALDELQRRIESFEQTASLSYPVEFSSG